MFNVFQRREFCINLCLLRLGAPVRPPLDSGYAPGVFHSRVFSAPVPGCRTLLLYLCDAHVDAGVQIVALIIALTGIILIIYSDTTFRSDGMLGAVLVVMATVGASGFKVRGSIYQVCNLVFKDQYDLAQQAPIHAVYAIRNI